MRRTDPYYKPGDFWRICDVCGFRYRASETRKQWNGLIVCPEDYETRNEQDYARGVADRQRVPDPRPEPTDVFLSANEVTADDL
jgi:hypothetical protein